MKTFLTTMALMLAVMPANAGEGLEASYIMPQDEAAMINAINTTSELESSPSQREWRATEHDILQIWNAYYKRPPAFAVSGTQPRDPASHILLPLRPGKSPARNVSRAVTAPKSAAVSSLTSTVLPLPQKTANAAASPSATTPATTPAATPATVNGTKNDNALANRGFEYNPPAEIRPSGASPSLAGDALNNLPPSGAKAGEVRLNIPQNAAGGNAAGTSSSTGANQTSGAALAPALPPAGQPTSLIPTAPVPPRSVPIPAGPYQGEAPAVSDRSIPIGQNGGR